MCKQEGESVNHLLLHCSMARELWTLVLSLFGVHQVMPKRVLDLLACWKGRFGRHWNGDIWNAIPLCMRWIIWKERNCRTFEGIKQSMMAVKLLFICTLYEWMVFEQSFIPQFTRFYGVLQFYEILLRYKYTNCVLVSVYFPLCLKNFTYLKKKKKTNKNKTMHKCPQFFFKLTICMCVMSTLIWYVHNILMLVSNIFAVC